MEIAVLANGGVSLLAPHGAETSIRSVRAATTRIVGISGSTHKPSRSRALLDALTLSLTGAPVVLYELADHAESLGSAIDRERLSGPAAEVVAAIESADALVVTCPVYKGSYPGLFKHLFDLVDAEALIGKPVLLGATGGGPRHALVVEHQLRPLFGFFMALSAPTAVYACDADFRDGRLVSSAVAERAAIAASQFAALVVSVSRPAEVP